MAESTTIELVRELVGTLVTDPPAIAGGNDRLICPLCWQFGTVKLEDPSHEPTCPYSLAKRLAERLGLKASL